MKKSILLLLLLGGSTLHNIQAQQLAFPGAEGFGKYAKGGRGGAVYHVTNLNDSGAGSLRDAISQPNRIIVFDVAGVIKISSRLIFSSNLYIAGQTAPGEGITVYGNGASFSGASNTIVRYMRFRMGKGGDSGKDAVGISNGTNIIFDHISASWGVDETFSINPDNKGSLGDITIQNSIMGQGLLSHSAGGLIQADNITLYRNLYVDNNTRNNKIKGKNQYVNNIVYNWNNGCYIMGGDSQGTSYCIAEGCLFINGPAGGGNAFGGGNADFHLYVNDNWQDRNRDGVLNPYEIPANEYSGGPTFHDTRFDYPEVPLWQSSELIEKLLPIVGASLPYRDYADCYMVNEVLSFGTEGNFLANENQLPFGAPTSWTVWGGVKKIDTDGDGMPDDWEAANGTDPTKDDAMVLADNGYANIENYINSLTKEDRDEFLRTPVCLGLKEATTNSLTLQWYDYTEGEDGFIVEIKKEGSFVEIGRTEADASNFTIENLEPGTAYTVRVKAYTEEGGVSEYTAETILKTRPEPVEMVDVVDYQSDYTWSAEDGVWDVATQNWNNPAVVYADDSKVLFEPLTDITVTLNEEVAPESIVVRDDATTVITGSGAISGTGSVNKAGEGTLKLATENSYTGATVLHDGTIEFATLKNGGVSSSIGASQEFAQNWIWDGGIWKYTGGSTSTNRSALTYKDTEFNIANSGAVVAMNGIVEGEGSFILNGEGQLTVGTTKFFGYEGNTILKGGTLFLKGTDIIDAGLGTSPKLVLAGGMLKTSDSNDRYGVYSFPIEVLKDTYSYLYVHRNCSIKSVVTGEGTLEYQPNYLREYITGDWDDFTGKLVINGVNSKSGECQFMIYNGKGIPNAVIETKGNVQIVCWASEATYYLGGLSGASGTYLCGTSKNNKSSKMTWIVGGAGTNETFRGVIDNRCSAGNYNGKTSIVKEGEGDWRLTGNNVYSGTTTVTDGRLIVNGTHSGTGTVTIEEEGTLCGTGTLAGKVTVKEEGTLYAGDTLVDNKYSFKLNGGLIVETGGIVSFPINCDVSGEIGYANKIAPKGELTINNATLQIDLSKKTEDFSSSCSFQLFDMSAVTSVKGTGFTNIIPAAPGEDLKWDTSELLTTGRLHICSASSVEANFKEGVSVWPLVVEDEVNITVPTSKAIVTMYTLAGEPLSSKEILAGTGTLQIGALAAGVYLLKVEGDKGNSTVQRIVKK